MPIFSSQAIAVLHISDLHIRRDAVRQHNGQAALPPGPEGEPGPDESLAARSRQIHMEELEATRSRLIKVLDKDDLVGLSETGADGSSEGAIVTAARTPTSKRIELKEWTVLWDQEDGKTSLKRTQLCLLTGDIAHSSPDPSVYAAMRDDLVARLGDAWKVVPGNHDRRRFGNFFVDMETFDAAFADWRRPWWNVQHALIIVPLDSNPEPADGRRVKRAISLARGFLGSETTRIADAMRSVKRLLVRRIAARLLLTDDRELVAFARHYWSIFPLSLVHVLVDSVTKNVALPDWARDKVVGYLARAFRDLFMARAVKCVMMHHHPVGIAGTENLGLTDQDAYLALLDSGGFLDAARANNINLVCHGHKHIPHRISVMLPGVDREPLGIVGCGSTTFGRDKFGKTANVISVSGAGTVDVELQYLDKQGWETRGKALPLRSWKNVKKHRADAAAGVSRCHMVRRSAEFTVFDNGDALCTHQYEGLESLVENGEIYLPIVAQAASVPRPPRFVREGLEDFSLEVRHVDADTWGGVVRCQRRSGDEKATLTVQSFSHCAFATNEWQFYGLYGDIDQWESTSLGCSFPVRGSLRLSVRVSDDCELEFTDVTKICNGLSDDENIRERDEIDLHIAPSERQVTVISSGPVWGADYGVKWRWKDAGPVRGLLVTPSVRSSIDELTELVATAHDGTSGPKLKRASEVVRRLESVFPGDVEACIYAVCRSPSEKLVLRQLAANDRLRRNGLQAVELPFGVGVAGRCIWTGEVTAWRSVGRASAEEQWADYYYAVGRGTRHTAILTIPIRVTEGDAPIAVLSLGTGTSDSFSSEVAAMLEAGHEGPGLSWVEGVYEATVQVLRDVL